MSRQKNEEKPEVKRVHERLIQHLEGNKHKDFKAFYESDLAKNEGVKPHERADITNDLISRAIISQSGTAFNFVVFLLQQVKEQSVEIEPEKLFLWFNQSLTASKDKNLRGDQRDQQEFIARQLYITITEQVESDVLKENKPNFHIEAMQAYDKKEPQCRLFARHVDLHSNRSPLDEEGLRKGFETHYDKIKDLPIPERTIFAGRLFFLLNTMGAAQHADKENTPDIKGWLDDWFKNRQRDTPDIAASFFSEEILNAKGKSQDLFNKCFNAVCYSMDKNIDIATRVQLEATDSKHKIKNFAGGFLSRFS